MSLQIESETGVLYDPVFLQILEDIPGGLTIETGRFPTATKEIKAGAILSASASSVGLYNLVKTVKLFDTIDTAACVTIQVYSNHELIVGEYIGRANLSAATIAAITKGVTSDIIVLTAGGGGFNIASLPGGTLLQECAAASTASANVLNAASAILRDTIRIRSDGGTLLGNIFAGAVVRGTVDESELPYFVTPADKVLLTSRIRYA